MLNFGTRTQGCQQPSVVNSMQQGAVEGTDVCLLVTAACSSVAATVCPWPPWQLRDPSLPTPLGPAPASCCPPTATKGKPHPPISTWAGECGGREPLLTRWPWKDTLLFLEGLGGLCAPSISLGEHNIPSLALFFLGPYGPVTHTTVPALGGPGPLCRVRGGTQGIVGHKGRAYRRLPHAHS